MPRVAPVCSLVLCVLLALSSSALVASWVAAATSGPDPCLSGPCVNGGVCQSGVLSPSDAAPWIFQCLCPNGFSGLQCQVNVNECTSNPCTNGATCTDGYVCTCTSGFGGAHCDAPSQQAVDPCALQPCANAGHCVRTASVGGFRCDCAPSWTGTHCTTPVPRDDSGGPNGACERGCSSHGTCVAVPPPLMSSASSTSALVPMCQCDVGWVTRDCSVAAPLLLCPDSDLCMFWAYDATRVHVQIVANTPGWFAVVVGGDAADPLTGDTWLFAVDDTTGQVTAVDTWASGQYVFPAVDTAQDLHNVTGYQVANQTVVSLSRLLCTGDVAQDTPLSPDALRMAYVLGASDAIVPFGQGKSAALWSMWWFGLQGIGAPTSPPRALSLMAATPTALTVAWAAPACVSTRAPLFYEVQLTDVHNGSVSPAFRTGGADDGAAPAALQLVSLRPASAYDVAVRADNGYGTSPWASLRVHTLALVDNTTTTTTNGSGAGAGTNPLVSAPDAPTLTGATPTSLTVAYGAPRGLAPELVRSFVLQIMTPPPPAAAGGGVSTDDDSAGSARWRTVCAGSMPTCTATGLSPATRYAVRVSAVAVAGTTPFSDVVVYTTRRADDGADDGPNGPRCTAPDRMGPDCSIRALVTPAAASAAVVQGDGDGDVVFAPVVLSAATGTTLAWKAQDGILYLRVHTRASDTATGAGPSWLGLGFGARPTDGMADLDALVLYPPDPTTLALAAAAGPGDPDLGSGSSTRPPSSSSPLPAIGVRCERRLGASRATTPALAVDQSFCSHARSWTERASEGTTTTTTTRVYVFQRPLFAAASAAAGIEPRTHTVDRGRTRVSWALGPNTGDGASSSSLSPGFARHRVHGTLDIDFFTGAVHARPAGPRHGPILAAVWLSALALAVLLALVVTRVRCVRDSRVGRWLWHRRVGPAALLSSKWQSAASAPCGGCGGVLASACNWVPRLVWGGALGVVGVYVAALVAYVAVMCAYEYPRAELSAYGVLGQLTAIHLTISMCLPTRNSVFAAAFFTSFERLLEWHQRAGVLFWALALAHGLHKWSVMQYAWWYLRAADASDNGDGAVFGAAAFVAFSVALAPAVCSGVRRRASYTAFRVTHALGPLVGVPLAMVHSVVFRYAVLVPLALWGVDVLVRGVRGHTRRFAVKVLSADRLGSGDAAVTRMSLQPSPAAKFKFAAGQYVFVNVPSISRLMWHPVSISSAPGSDGSSFTLHVRDMSASYAAASRGQRNAALHNTWSHSLWSAAGSHHHGAQVGRGSHGGRGAGRDAAVVRDDLLRDGAVKVDGPYGRLRFAPDALSQYAVVLLVGGGIGVTPLMSVLGDVQQRHAATAAVAAGGGGASNEFAALRACHLVWVCSSPAPFHDWFADALRAVERAPNRALFHTHLLSTDRHASSSSHNGAAGSGASSPSRSGTSSGSGGSRSGSSQSRSDSSGGTDRKQHADGGGAVAAAAASAAGRDVASQQSSASGDRVPAAAAATTTTTTTTDVATTVALARTPTHATRHGKRLSPKQQRKLAAAAAAAAALAAAAKATTTSAVDTKHAAGEADSRNRNSRDTSAGGGGGADHTVGAAQEGVPPEPPLLSTTLRVGVPSPLHGGGVHGLTSPLGSGGGSTGGVHSPPPPGGDGAVSGLVDLQMFAPVVRHVTRADVLALCETLVCAVDAGAAAAAGAGPAAGGGGGAPRALRSSDVAVISCGPPGLSDDVAALCHRMGWHHHAETFFL